MGHDERGNAISNWQEEEQHIKQQEDELLNFVENLDYDNYINDLEVVNHNMLGECNVESIATKSNGHQEAR